jgi:hypothetical protein
MQFSERKKGVIEAGWTESVRRYACWILQQSFYNYTGNSKPDFSFRNI